MLTMHLLVELLVKHHPSVESVAIMQVFVIAIPTTAFRQDELGSSPRNGRSPIRSLPNKGETLQVASEFLVVFTGRGTPTSRHTLGTSSATETIRSTTRCQLRGVVDRGCVRHRFPLVGNSKTDCFRQDFGVHGSLVCAESDSSVVLLVQRDIHAGRGRRS